MAHAAYLFICVYVLSKRGGWMHFWLNFRRRIFACSNITLNRG